MFGVIRRRETREQFRLLEMEIDLLKNEIICIKGKGLLPYFPDSTVRNMSNELFNYNELREKYRPFRKVFD